MYRKPTFWGDKCAGGKGRWENGNLRPLNVTFCSLSPHYNETSLADEKFPSCTGAGTLRSKAK